MCCCLGTVEFVSLAYHCLESSLGLQAYENESWHHFFLATHSVPAVYVDTHCYLLCCSQDRLVPLKLI